MKPSLVATAIHGIIMTIVIIMTVVHWNTLTNYRKIIIISLLSIQIAIHAVLHHILEIYYDFNPLDGKYTPRISV